MQWASVCIRSPSRCQCPLFFLFRHSYYINPDSVGSQANVEAQLALANLVNATQVRHKSPVECL